MNVDSKKIEIIDWIAQLKDKGAIEKLLLLKKRWSKGKKHDAKIFGSGKHLIDYISDDFNEPLDIFKEYQK